MAKPRITPGQHPYDVARACVRSARRWARDPLGVYLARQALAPYAPTSRDTSGAWVPGALRAWASGLTYYREPPLNGELVYSLPYVIAANGGDCDDLTASQAAIAAAVGVPARVCVLWPRAGNTAHVFCAVGPDWESSPTQRLAWRCVDPDLPDHPAPCGVAGVSVDALGERHHDRSSTERLFSQRI